LHRIPGEPILVTSVRGRLERGVFLHHFDQIHHALQEIGSPSGIIFDMVELSPLTAADLEPLVGEIIQGFSQIEFSCFFVCITKDEGWLEVEEFLLKVGVRLPIFASFDRAYSYLSLKLSTEYLRQTITLRDTQDIEVTTPMRTDEILQMLEERHQDVLGETVFPPNGVLYFEAVEMNKNLLVFPDHTLIVGRRDANHDAPDVDLSLWAAYQHGVSRKHAKLVLNPDQTLFLFDLNSMNGTFINGNRLEPFEPVALRDGDYVAFGSLPIRIHFRHAMNH